MSSTPFPFSVGPLPISAHACHTSTDFQLAAAYSVAGDTGFQMEATYC
ncbi:hypothetical protein [Corynebacterium phocae]|nr:hypothetical protein [Corynebacterium phocae]